MKIDGIVVVYGAFFGGMVEDMTTTREDWSSRIVWNALTLRKPFPRGDRSFRLGVRPQRALLPEEVAAIREYCNERFGVEGWALAHRANVILFQSKEDRFMFVTRFGRVVADPAGEETVSVAESG